MSGSNSQVRRQFARLASYYIAPSHRDLIKGAMAGCDIFGQQEANARAQMDSRNDPDRFEFLEQHELEIEACRSIAIGHMLLSGLIMCSASEMDRKLKVGRVETVATLLIENLEFCIFLGISSELTEKAERILEKLGEWGENADPIWAPPSKNSGLLTRVTELFPDVHIMRSSLKKRWVFFSGDSDQENISAKDFGHLLSEALTQTKSDTRPSRQRDPEA